MHAGRDEKQKITKIGALCIHAIEQILCILHRMLGKVNITINYKHPLNVLQFQSV